MLPSPETAAQTSKRRRAVVRAVGQDKLLAEAVKTIEQKIAASKGSLTWSLLAVKGNVSKTTLANWRSGRTRSGLTRTINSTLKPLGLTLAIVRRD